MCFQLLLTVPSVLKEVGGRLDFEFACCHLLDTEAHRRDVRHKRDSITTGAFRNYVIFNLTVPELQS